MEKVTSTATVSEQLAAKLVGQPRAIESLVPHLETYRAGLSPAGRPAGVFLLLGPSGTGKTRTVEALAELLHGSASHVLRIDCGEFQAEHEVAKLLGAPPGYVGHRESPPMLTQKRLAEVTSPACDLSLVLFDEIEKAAPSIATVLLGILDKASLRLGDGTTVDFEKSFIFLTSNLGAREMGRELGPRFGFRHTAADASALGARLESIGVQAVRKRFSPEFVNRLDAIVTYDPLDDAALAAILDQQLSDLQAHLDSRLAERSFDLTVAEGARRFLIDRGANAEYGARELRRVIQKHLAHPVAVLVASGEIPPGAEVTVDVNAQGSALAIHVGAVTSRREAPAPATVLVVEDNEALANWVENYLTGAGCRVLRAHSVAEARQHLDACEPSAAFVDWSLPDGSGLELAADIRTRIPHVVVMTGAQLSELEMAVCSHADLAVLRKPFPGPRLLDLIGVSAGQPTIRMAS